jgi:hypothetical protein
MYQTLFSAETSSSLHLKAETSPLLVTREHVRTCVTARLVLPALPVDVALRCERG